MPTSGLHLHIPERHHAGGIFGHNSPAPKIKRDSGLILTPLERFGETLQEIFLRKGTVC